MKKFIFYIFVFIFSKINFVFSQQSFADTVEKVIPSVVNISAIIDKEKDENINDNKITSLGSGFFIDKDGYIITNKHVIDESEIVNIITNDNKNFEAVVVGSDEKTDIALLKISEKYDIKPVIFGDSDKIRIGDWVLAIGNPFGLGESVTAGIISAKSRDIDSGSYNDFIQTDASINQGNSGGPLFNTEGEVIGMNTSIFSTTGNNMGINFATPSNIISWVADQLKNYGKVNRGWIGIKMQSEQLEYIKDENSPINSGIMVLGISENSPAQKAGIIAGDIIIKINDKYVESPKIFLQEIYKSKIGEKIKITIWNNKKITEKIIDVGYLNENTNNNLLNKKDFNYTYVPKIGNIYKNKDTQGITIYDIEKDSSAFSQDIKAGDILLKVDSYQLNSVNDLLDYIDNIKFSDKKEVILSILRDNEIRNVKINLE